MQHIYMVFRIGGRALMNHKMHVQKQYTQIIKQIILKSEFSGTAAPYTPAH